jgi:heat shock protein HslJ
MFKVSIGIMMAAALCGCCSKGVAPTAAPAAEESAAEAILSGKYETKAANGTKITLELDAGKNGYSGRVVNNYSGNYKTDGNRIAFGPAAATMMMGLPGPMEAERAYFKFLDKAAEYGTSSGVLMLIAIDGEKMEFERK